jgi:hypothetical protein
MWTSRISIFASTGQGQYPARAISNVTMLSSTTRSSVAKRWRNWKDVAHGCEEFAVVLGNNLLSGARSIQTTEGRSFPNDVVGVKVERRFDFIDGLAVKVLLHARQVSGNPVVVHRYLLCMPVITTAQPL